MKNDLFSTNCDLFFKDNKIIISDNEKESYKANTLEPEIIAILKLLQTGKSPKSDGLATKFYNFSGMTSNCLWLKSLDFLL